MREVLNPIALRALAAARASMPQRPIYRSRTADKFVIRASTELLKAMTELGRFKAGAPTLKLSALCWSLLRGVARLMSLARSTLRTSERKWLST